jgi:hypothetical protein
MSKRCRSSDQPDLFAPPPPMIRGETNLSGRDVWYCRRTCRWTTDPEDLSLSDAELMVKYGPAWPLQTEEQLEPCADALAMGEAALREKVLREFDEVFGPEEAWR